MGKASSQFLRKVLKMISMVLGWIAGLFFRNDPSVLSLHALRKKAISLKREEAKIFAKLERQEQTKTKIFQKACTNRTTDKQKEKLAQHICCIDRKINYLQEQWTANYENQKLVESRLQFKVWENNHAIDLRRREWERIDELARIARKSARRHLEEVGTTDHASVSFKDLEAILNNIQMISEPSSKTESTFQDNLPDTAQQAADVDQAIEKSSGKKN